jgi:hypothetical protein
VIGEELHAMHQLMSGQTMSGGFLRSAQWLTAVTLSTALLLVPYAMRQSGTAGMLGVVVAAGICLMSGLASEGFAAATGRSGAPLIGMLVGLAARMAPPLAICLVLASRGVDGRRHLAFVCYLLVFYFATLALETWLAVRRVSARRESDS